MEGDKGAMASTGNEVKLRVATWSGLIVIVRRLKIRFPEVAV
jgi:hypothetical protein